jgi:hypothetical protein
MAKATGIKTKLIDAVLLGSAIWLIGYIVSIILYGLVPSSLLGWVLFVLLAPLTVYITYLRFRKRKETAAYYFAVALVWVMLAVVFDYLLIVKAFGAQGYYKADVFVYYLTTFIITIAVGLKYGQRR